MIGGDGIGPEVTDAVIRILKNAGLRIDHGTGNLEAVAGANHRPQGPFPACTIRRSFGIRTDPASARKAQRSVRCSFSRKLLSFGPSLGCQQYSLLGDCLRYVLVQVRSSSVKLLLQFE